MSTKSSGKSPYQRSNSAARGRSWMLVVTVVVLLLGAGAWIMSYTRAVELTPIGGTAPVIDPGSHAATTTVPAGSVSGSTSPASN